MQHLILIAKLTKQTMTLK